MTNRERIFAAFNHMEVDRTPIFEYLLGGECARALAKRTYIDYTIDLSAWNNSVDELGFSETLKRYVSAKLDISELLGHDMLYVCPNPVPEKGYFYDPLVTVDTFFSLDSSVDPVERVQIRNEKVREEYLEKTSPDSFAVYAEFQDQMADRGIDLPIFAPAYFHGIWNDVDLMQTVLLSPEVAKEHFRIATIRAKQIIDQYLGQDIQIIGIGGDFAGKVPLISPEVYREFIVPEVRILADYIRSRSGFSVNATDGNIWSVIDDFIYGCGVDAYMEIDYSAGMTIGRLKKRFGKKLTLMGNMDCGTILTYAKESEIAEITHTILDEGWRNGGHIFTASNAITSSVPLHNYLAMVNAYRNHFSVDPIKLKD